MMSITDDGEYGQKQIDFLELIWGEGFLSPGGTKEVDLVLEGLNLNGLNILDIGCGCGGAAFHLIREHGAASVVGIDIEPLPANDAKLVLCGNATAPNPIGTKSFEIPVKLE